MSIPIGLGDEYLCGPNRPKCPDCGALLHDRHRCRNEETDE